MAVTQMPPEGPGGPREAGGGDLTSLPVAASGAAQSVLLTQQTSLLRVSLLTPGCLAEQWSGKKGDTAALGGKKSKKKSGKVKASGSGSKQRKELGGLEEDPSPDEDEGIQKASPLTHSPPDEL